MHLGSQRAQISVGAVIAAAGIDVDGLVGGAAVGAFGEHRPERAADELAEQVPDRDVERRQSHRAIAVTAGFLVRHGGAPHRLGVDQTGAVDQVFRCGSEDARDQALAQNPALGIPARRRESDPDHRPARPACIGDHRCRTDGHGAEIDRGVSQAAADARGGFANLDDAHAAGAARCRQIRNTPFPVVWVSNRRYASSA